MVRAVRRLAAGHSERMRRGAVVISLVMAATTVVLAVRVTPSSSAPLDCGASTDSTSPSPPICQHGFVTHTGAQLMLDGNPFKFVGVNIYNANNRGDCCDCIEWPARAVQYHDTTDLHCGWNQRQRHHTARRRHVHGPRRPARRRLLECRQPGEPQLQGDLTRPLIESTCSAR